MSSEAMFDIFVKTIKWCNSKVYIIIYLKFIYEYLFTRCYLENYLLHENLV